MAYVYIDGKVKYPQCFEFNRDMGKNLDEGSDIRNKIEADQGHYLAQFYPDGGHAALKKAGIPSTGMLGQLYKTDQDGNEYYKCKRPHFNPRLEDRETGEKGIVMGPPNVGQVIDGEWVEWNPQEDGLIGNDSTVRMKFNVWKDRIVTWEGMQVVEHIPFEVEEEVF